MGKFIRERKNMEPVIYYQFQYPSFPVPKGPSDDGIRISSNTISWPVDGWYEVQCASSFNTVSEGGTPATLDPGTYNVINHTTGVRFENVIVGEANEEPPKFFLWVDQFRDSQC